MYFMGNGSIHSSLCHLKTKSREVLIEYVRYVSEGQIHAHCIIYTKCRQYDITKSVQLETLLDEAYMVEISTNYPD